MAQIRVYRPAPNQKEFIERYRNDFAHYPRMDNATYFLKYVKIAIWAKVTGRKVTQHEIAEAKRKLLRYLQDHSSETKYEAYCKGVEDVWEDLAERMKRSPAVLQYFLDFATRSTSLANFMHWVPCSETMENARGFGYDLTGCYGPLDPDDVAFYWSLRTPVLAGICLRIQYAQDVINSWIERFRRNGKKRPVRVLFVGAGRLPELRSYNAVPEWFNQLEIVAVDEDSGVQQNINELFDYAYNKSLTDLGFVWVDRDMSEEQINDVATSKQAMHRYYNMSLDEFKKKSEYNGYFDIVIMDGVMSYYRSNTVTMLASIRGLMRDEGQLVIDLQLLNLFKDWSLLQHKVALDWNTVPQLDPDLSARAAHKRILRDCNTVGLTLDDAVLYPADPGKGAVNIGIGFILRRQSSWRKV